ncbi:hypothetical protein EYR40_010704 [Pleurotus pulmonarius]|nr:hypothetical protein EYR36_002475 [Pleurotus pulmonarius]KAF4586689.1 hypothetical protein EYR40_010704 [Pleurotus pulmonarius]
MFYLRWTKPIAEPSHLPSGLSRTFVDTEDGKLELIVAEPPSSYIGPRKRPIFFQHGGMGQAGVWIEWMTYLSQRHNTPCYALSLRGHGLSWYPSYISMVYLTTKRALANDLVKGIKYVEQKEKAEVVLVGHSSGGGLSQIILDAGDVSVAGLVLAASIPCYGSLGVYMNWWKMDPWFSLRMWGHFLHPNSPLSSTGLVKRAFFCDAKPDSEVDAFAQKMSYYESFLWPLGMMLGRLVDVRNVVKRISGWESRGCSLMVLAAEKDRLMSIKQMKGAAEHYRGGLMDLIRTKKLDSVESGDPEGDVSGVRFRVVAGAGHHLQNDIQWHEGACEVVGFYEQL